jgi:hypothetical protein
MSNYKKQKNKDIRIRSYRLNKIEFVGMQGIRRSRRKFSLAPSPPAINFENEYCSLG